MKQRIAARAGDFYDRSAHPRFLKSKSAYLHSSTPNNLRMWLKRPALMSMNDADLY